MNRIKLVTPTAEHRERLMEYKKAFNQLNETMHGDANLQNTVSYEEWLQALKLNSNEETVEAGFVPATAYLAILTADDRVIGMIHIRHRLNAYLEQFGGHIGYSIAPNERQKGYATEMLGLALEECGRLQLDRVLITCNKSNPASAKTIINNGGQLENEILEENGLPEQNEIIQRYWIEL